MTVYVDDMYTRGMGQFNRMKMSHMIADTEDEIHAMAKAIGMRQYWYQEDHYDVSMSRRKQALRLGAVPITLRQCSIMCFVRKVTGKLPKPSKAEEKWRALQDKLRRPPRKKTITRIRLRMHRERLR